MKTFIVCIGCAMCYVCGIGVCCFNFKVFFTCYCIMILITALTIDD